MLYESYDFTIRGVTGVAVFEKYNFQKIFKNFQKIFKNFQKTFKNFRKIFKNFRKSPFITHGLQQNTV